MSIELATAYVSLVPSMKGAQGALSREFGDAGKDGGSAASAAFGDEMAGGAEGAASKFGGLFKAGMVGVGLAAGAVLMKGISDAIDAEASSDKLAAQLGLSPAEATRLGGVAGDLYAQAYGDSLADVNEALKGTMQAGLVDPEATNAEIESVTAKALDLATAFDQDVGAASAAAGQLIRTGLAKDATEAFDIITAGFQGGVDKSGDFLDTINEYGTQFRKVGIDGATMTGLLTQGLQAGARDADIVADSIKEFSIRAVDGSALTADSFAKLGLSGEEMTAKIAAGGPEAAAALDQTLDKLRGIEDPALRAQIATGLFGTQAEDLGDALFALDPSEATAGMADMAGAAERMGTTLNDNTATKIESFKRGAMQGLTDFLGGTVIPGIEALATAFGEGGIAGVFQMLSDRWSEAWPKIQETLATFGENVLTWISEQVPVIAGKLAEWAGALIEWVLPQIPPLLEKLGEVISKVGEWVLNEGLPLLVEKLKEWGLAFIEWIGPQIPPLISEMSKLAARLTEWILTDALPMLVEKLAEWGLAFVGWVAKDAIPGLLGALGDLMTALGRWFVDDAIPGVIAWAADLGGSIVDEIGKLPDRISSAASGMFDGVKDAFKAAINWLIDKWNDFSITIGGGSFLGQDIPEMTLDTPNLPRFHDGGIVPGRPGQEVLSILQAGEQVLTADQQRAIGGATSWTINADGLTADEAAQYVPRAILHAQLVGMAH